MKALDRRPSPHHPFISRAVAVVVGALGLLSLSRTQLAIGSDLSGECAHNLQVIHQAVTAYVKDHGDYPASLTQLSGNYISPVFLICPSCQRSGSTAVKNSALINWLKTDTGTSYKWEFFPTKANLPNSKQVRQRARETEIGDWVPMVRCDQHQSGKRDHINLAFNGQVYWSRTMWEAEFTHILSAYYLAPTSLLADVRSIRSRLPPRTETIPAQCVDLSQWYNALLTDPWIFGVSLDSMEELASRCENGLLVFTGVAFDLRGAIQLGGLSDKDEPTSEQEPIEAKYDGKVKLCLEHPKFATAARDVSVGRSAVKVHALIGGVFPTNAGAEVASLELSYSDGSKASLPLLYGFDFVDAWHDPMSTEYNAQNRHRIVFEMGPSKETRRQLTQERIAKWKPLGVYLKTWDNPKPDVEIKSIDFVSSALGPRPAPTCPFLLAITVE